MKKKKIISAMAAQAVMLSMLTACGDIAKDEISGETFSVSEQSEGENVSEETEKISKETERVSEEKEIIIDNDNNESLIIGGEEKYSVENLSDSADDEKELHTENTSEDEGFSAESSFDDIALYVNNVHSWNDRSNDYTQIEAAVKNNSDKTLKDWTVTIAVGENVSVEQHWNCSISYDDGTLTVTPVDFNEKIEPNESRHFGMILKNSDKITSSDVKITDGDFSDPKEDKEDKDDKDDYYKHGGKYYKHSHHYYH